VYSFHVVHFTDEANQELIKEIANCRRYLESKRMGNDSDDEDSIRAGGSINPASAGAASTLNDTNIDLSKLSECFRENLKNLARINSDQHQALLTFHDVCGKNIILSASGRVAKRIETSFCDAIVFSQRPVYFNEKVYIRVVQTSDLWTSMIRFGFTSVDPDSLRKRRFFPGSEPTARSMDDEDEDDDYPYNLPKYVYPDLTNKDGKLNLKV
jgi:hypothetical protein